MRIAVFGGCRPSQFSKDWTPGPPDEFKQAARELGRQIAGHEHTVCVGGIGEWSADRQVVAGFLIEAAANKNTRARVQVMRPRGDALAHQNKPYEAEARELPVFIYPDLDEGWWEGAHLMSIQDAHAIITIGGGRSTYLAGLAGIVAGKIVIPIGSFGGASRDLLKIRTRREEDEALLDKLQQLNGPWSSQVRDTVLHLGRIVTPPRILLIHGRSSDWQDLSEWFKNNSRVTVEVIEEQILFGSTLIEKFERYASQVDGAIVLATADDLGHLAGEQGPAKRARQNVWLETGWIWGRMGRDHLMILTKSNLEMPSDLHGLEVFRYEHSPLELAGNLREFVASLK